MKKSERQTKNGNWQISFWPVLRYSIIFCLLILLIMLLGGAILSVTRMKSDAQASMDSVHAQISQRVNESLTLLESLASLREYYDPEVPPIEKVKKLDQISPYFGYLMICYVDEDINVYSDGAEPASLASRDYMQRLFSTGQRQVTDSFAAGADGVTLNYTVAVPLFDQEDNITGALFCAIYFDEMVKILEQSSGINQTDAVLIGTKGQIMSSTNGLAYGGSMVNELQDSFLIGITADGLVKQLLDAVPGHYWSFKNGELSYTLYQRVENTNWDILCSVNFFTVFSGVLPSLLVVMGLTLVVCIGLMLFMRRYIRSQMQVVDLLVHSVEELEKKIYQDERPEDVDFNEIIRLTSNGLSDCLTGVVTRSVFLNQAASYLKKSDPELVTALCFIDMDNLKHINDTYGHNGGDVALKSIGYILREYEKKYDGAVGRYGGDEFVLLLQNLDDKEELLSVMDELVLRLHTEIGSAGQHIPIQCSVGVAVYQPGDSLERLISNADEALYFVKQNGKGYYKLYNN